MKKIDEVFRMVSEINRNSPTRGLSPIPLREQTPPLRQRSASRNPIKRKSAPLAPNTSFPCRRHRPIIKRTNNWREMKWRRATTLFEDKDRLWIFAAGSFDRLLISKNIENYRMFFTSDSLIFREQLVR